MFEKGLVYRKSSPVNYCRKCQTVLANEQVEGGACWRCGEEVIQKELTQWFFAITRYADELYEYCDKLPGWPERVLNMQKNWIGKSYGVEVDFPMEDGTPLTIFTTRPDTLYRCDLHGPGPGTSPCPLPGSRHHPGTGRPFLREQGKGTGQEFQGRDRDQQGRCIHRKICHQPPDRDKSTYLHRQLRSYGIRDRRHYVGAGSRPAGLSSSQKSMASPSLLPSCPKGRPLIRLRWTGAYEGDGKMVNSGPFNGRNNREAIPSIIDYLEEKKMGKQTVNYRLRDWGISRQRYWGAPNSDYPLR